MLLLLNISLKRQTWSCSVWLNGCRWSVIRRGQKLAPPSLPLELRQQASFFFLLLLFYFLAQFVHHTFFISLANSSSIFPLSVCFCFQVLLFPNLFCNFHKYFFFCFNLFTFPINLYFSLPLRISTWQKDNIWQSYAIYVVQTIIFINSR